MSSSTVEPLSNKKQGLKKRLLRFFSRSEGNLKEKVRSRSEGDKSPAGDSHVEKKIRSSWSEKRGRKERNEGPEGAQSLPRLRHPKSEDSVLRRSSRDSKARSFSYSDLEVPSSNLLQRFGSLTWRKKRSSVLEDHDANANASSSSRSHWSMGRLDRPAVGSDLDLKNRRPVSCIIDSPFSEFASKSSDQCSKRQLGGKKAIEVSTSFDHLTNDDEDYSPRHPAFKGRSNPLQLPLTFLGKLEVEDEDESLPCWAESILKDYLTPEHSTPDSQRYPLYDETHSSGVLEEEEKHFHYRSPIHHLMSTKEKIVEQTSQKAIALKSDVDYKEGNLSREKNSTCAVIRKQNSQCQSRSSLNIQSQANVQNGKSRNQVNVYTSMLSENVTLKGSTEMVSCENIPLNREGNNTYEYESAKCLDSSTKRTKQKVSTKKHMPLNKNSLQKEIQETVQLQEHLFQDTIKDKEHNVTRLIHSNTREQETILNLSELHENIKGRSSPSTPKIKYQVIITMTREEKEQNQLPALAQDLVKGDELVEQDLKLSTSLESQACGYHGAGTREVIAQSLSETSEQPEKNTAQKEEILKKRRVSESCQGERLERSLSLEADEDCPPTHSGSEQVAEYCRIDSSKMEKRDKLKKDNTIPKRVYASRMPEMRRSCETSKWSVKKDNQQNVNVLNNLVSPQAYVGHVKKIQKIFEDIGSKDIGSKDIVSHHAQPVKSVNVSQREKYCVSDQEVSNAGLYRPIFSQVFNPLKKEHLENRIEHATISVIDSSGKLHPCIITENYVDTIEDIVENNDSLGKDFAETHLSNSHKDKEAFQRHTRPTLQDSQLAPRTPTSPTQKIKNNFPFSLGSPKGWKNESAIVRPTKHFIGQRFENQRDTTPVPSSKSNVFFTENFSNSITDSDLQQKGEQTNHNRVKQSQKEHRTERNTTIAPNLVYEESPAINTKEKLVKSRTVRGLALLKNKIQEEYKKHEDLKQTVETKGKITNLQLGQQIKIDCDSLDLENQEGSAEEPMISPNRSQRRREDFQKHISTQNKDLGSSNDSNRLRVNSDKHIGRITKDIVDDGTSEISDGTDKKSTTHNVVQNRYTALLNKKIVNNVDLDAGQLIQSKKKTEMKIFEISPINKQDLKYTVKGLSQIHQNMEVKHTREFATQINMVPTAYTDKVPDLDVDQLNQGIKKTEIKVSEISPINKQDLKYSVKGLSQIHQNMEVKHTHELATQINMVPTAYKDKVPDLDVDQLNQGNTKTEIKVSEISPINKQDLKYSVKGLSQIQQNMEVKNPQELATQINMVPTAYKDKVPDLDVDQLNQGNTKTEIKVSEISPINKQDLKYSVKGLSQIQQNMEVKNPQELATQINMVPTAYKDKVPDLDVDQLHQGNKKNEITILKKLPMNKQEKKRGLSPIHQNKELRHTHKLVSQKGTLPTAYKDEASGLIIETMRGHSKDEDESVCGKKQNTSMEPETHISTGQKINGKLKQEIRGGIKGDSSIVRDKSVDDIRKASLESAGYKTFEKSRDQPSTDVVSAYTEQNKSADMENQAVPVVITSTLVSSDQLVNNFNNIEDSMVSVTLTDVQKEASSDLAIEHPMYKPANDSATNQIEDIKTQSVDINNHSGQDITVLVTSAKHSWDPGTYRVENLINQGENNMDSGIRDDLLENFTDLLVENHTEKPSPRIKKSSTEGIIIKIIEVKDRIGEDFTGLTDSFDDSNKHIGCTIKEESANMSVITQDMCTQNILADSFLSGETIGHNLEDQMKLGEHNVISVETKKQPEENSTVIQNSKINNVFENVFEVKNREMEKDVTNTKEQNVQQTIVLSAEIRDQPLEKQEYLGDRRKYSNLKFLQEEDNSKLEYTTDATVNESIDVENFRENVENIVACSEAVDKSFLEKPWWMKENHRFEYTTYQVNGLLPVASIDELREITEIETCGQGRYAKIKQSLDQVDKVSPKKPEDTNKKTEIDNNNWTSTLDQAMDECENVTVEKTEDFMDLKLTKERTLQNGQENEDQIHITTDVRNQSQDAMNIFSANDIVGQARIEELDGDQHEGVIHSRENGLDFTQEAETLATKESKHEENHTNNQVLQPMDTAVNIREHPHDNSNMELKQDLGNTVVDGQMENDIAGLQKQYLPQNLDERLVSLQDVEGLRHLPLLELKPMDNQEKVNENGTETSNSIASLMSSEILKAQHSFLGHTETRSDAISVTSQGDDGQSHLSLPKLKTLDIQKNVYGLSTGTSNSIAPMIPSEPLDVKIAYLRDTDSTGNAISVALKVDEGQSHLPLSDLKTIDIQENVNDLHRESSISIAPVMPSEPLDVTISHLRETETTGDTISVALQGVEGQSHLPLSEIKTIDIQENVYKLPEATSNSIASVMPSEPLDLKMSCLGDKETTGDTISVALQGVERQSHIPLPDLKTIDSQENENELHTETSNFIADVKPSEPLDVKMSYLRNTETTGDTIRVALLGFEGQSNIPLPELKTIDSQENIYGSYKGISNSIESLLSSELSDIQISYSRDTKTSETINVATESNSGPSLNYHLQTCKESPQTPKEDSNAAIKKNAAPCEEENMESWVNKLRQLETPEFLRYQKPRRQPHSAPQFIEITLSPIKEDQGSPKCDQPDFNWQLQEKEETLKVIATPSENSATLETKATEQSEQSEESPKKFSWERNLDKTTVRSSPLELMRKHSGEEGSRSENYKALITQSLSQRQTSIIGSLLLSDRLDKKSETSEGKPFSRLESSYLLSSYLKPKKDLQQEKTDQIGPQDMSSTDQHTASDSLTSASGTSTVSGSLTSASEANTVSGSLTSASEARTASDLLTNATGANTASDLLTSASGANTVSDALTSATGANTASDLLTNASGANTASDLLTNASGAITASDSLTSASGANTASDLLTNASGANTASDLLTNASGAITASDSLTRASGANTASDSLTSASGASTASDLLTSASGANTASDSLTSASGANTASDLLTNASGANTASDLLTNASGANTASDSLTSALGANTASDLLTNASGANTASDLLTNASGANTASDSLTSASGANTACDSLTNASAENTVSGSLTSASGESTASDSLTSASEENTVSDFLTSASRENTASDSLTSASGANTVSDSLTNTSGKNTISDSLTSAPGASTACDSLTNASAENTVSGSLTSASGESTASDSLTSASEENTVSDFLTSASRENTVSDFLTSASGANTVSDSLTNTSGKNTISDSLTSAPGASTASDSLTSASEANTVSDFLTSASEANTVSDFLTSASGANTVGGSLTSVSGGNAASDSLTSALGANPVSDSLTSVSEANAVSDSLTSASGANTVSDSLTNTSGVNTVNGSLTCASGLNTAGGSLTNVSGANAVSDSLTNTSGVNTVSDSLTSAPGASTASDSLTSASEGNTVSDSLTNTSGVNTVSDSLTNASGENTVSDSLTSAPGASTASDSLTSASEANTVSDSLTSVSGANTGNDSLNRSLGENTAIVSLTSVSGKNTTHDSLTNATEAGKVSESLTGAPETKTTSDSLTSASVIKTNSVTLTNASGANRAGDILFNASGAQKPEDKEYSAQLQSDNVPTSDSTELLSKLGPPVALPCKVFPDVWQHPEKIHGKLNPRPGKIILFSEPGFRGHRHEIYSDVGNMSDWDLQGTVSICIVRGGWLLYEKPQFRGKRVMLTEGDTDLPCPWEVVKATSETLSNNTKKPKFWIGSLRHVVRDFQVPQISLFTEENGEGNKVKITGATPDSRVHGHSTKTESIIVHNGLWLVHSKPFFEGDPYILEPGGYPNRKAWNGQDSHMCSLQPARIGGPTVEKSNEPKILLFKYPGFQGPVWEVSKDLHSLQGELNSDGECLLTVGSVSVLGGCWVGYENEGFHGHQYLLEEGKYRDWSTWGGCSDDLGSLRHICTDFSAPEIVLYEQPGCSDGPCLRLNEALSDIELAQYGTKTESIHVLNGVWVAYENVDFSGEQYILEKGIYHSYQDWGAKDSHVCSVQPVLQVGGQSLQYSPKIQLYSEPNFHGDCMTIVEDHSLIPESFSLQSCRVEGGSWSLYEGEDYRGEQYILSEGDYPTRTAMGCQGFSTISSLKRVPLYFSVPSISLHGLEKFEGKELNFTGEIRSLQGEGYNNHVLSIKVKSGLWVLYEHSDFRGRQWLLEHTQIPNWLLYSGLQRIGSLCPIRQRRVYFRLRNRVLGLFLCVLEPTEDVRAARVHLSEPQEGSCDLWFYEDGRIKNQLVPQMSLQVVGLANQGTKVVLWSEERKPVQTWTLEDSGYIVSCLFKGLCLDIKGGHGYDSKHVVVWEVLEDRPSQRWDLEVY